MEDSNFDFRYVRLCDLDILREKCLNYLQTVETLVRCCILWFLIRVCTACQLPFYGSPDYNQLKRPDTVTNHVQTVLCLPISLNI